MVPQRRRVGAKVVETAMPEHTSAPESQPEDAPVFNEETTYTPAPEQTAVPESEEKPGQEKKPEEAKAPLRPSRNDEVDVEKQSASPEVNDDNKQETDRD